MIRQLAAAISFLTRMPIAPRTLFSAEDIGKANRWFPIVGALIGGVYALTARILSPRFPAVIVGILVITVEAFLTGALHMDALADMADGFGGGRTREDVLRIMRDHAIGSYGAVALILLLLMKVSLIGALIEHGRAIPLLVTGPALGRWSAVALNNFLPYARRQDEGVRPGGAVSHFVGPAELTIATVMAILLTVWLGWRTGAACWLAVVIVTCAVGALCRRRVGGVTGDTLGANIEICEVAVWLVGLGMN